MHIKKTRNILVVGQGPQVKPLVAALGRVPGVGMVRHVREMDMRSMVGQDIVVEMTGGVAPAFKVAMDALGQGLSLLTANPLLVAAHGNVLQRAAAGQQAYFGFQAAAFGLPLAEMLATLPLQKLTASWCTAATMALGRMGFRNENLVQVQAHLALQKVDTSDWGGKVTQARALALRALWQNEPLPLAKQLRVGLDEVEPADVKRLRGFGLQMVFGAEVMRDSLYVGPMAVAPDSPLMAGTSQDVLVGEDENSEIVLSCNADEDAAESGLLADVRQILRAVRPVMAPLGYGREYLNEEARAYVRIAAGQREVVLGCKPEILQEHMDGDGLWQAVVAVPELAELQAVRAAGGMVYPLSGTWQPEQAGLRLVG